MSSHFIQVHVPPAVCEPRGARWVGALAALAVGLQASIRRGPTADKPAPARGDKDLLALAARVEHDMPVLAVALRAIAGHQARST